MRRGSIQSIFRVIQNVLQRRKKSLACVLKAIFLNPDSVESATFHLKQRVLDASWAPTADSVPDRVPGDLRRKVPLGFRTQNNIPSLFLLRAFHADALLYIPGARLGFQQGS